MFVRRRATEKELQQGEQEMMAAQQRMDAELATGAELQIEDATRPEVSRGQESPKTPKMDDKLGSEDGPKSAPKSFAPQAALQDVQEPATGSMRQEPKTPRITEAPKASPAQVDTLMLTPQVALESSGALVPATFELSAVKTEKSEKGVSNGPLSAQNVSGRAQQPDPASAASMSQTMATPAPLFDEQQLRQFHEMYAQAPWLYPGAQQFAMPQMPLQPPPVARPLFLEQDERRIQGSMRAGELPQFVYPYGQPLGPDQPGLRRELELLVSENRKLRERIEVLEKTPKEDEPQFSTPTGDQREAETTKEAADPHHKRPAEEPRSSQHKEAETTKEAADHHNRRSTEEPRSSQFKEAADPHQQKPAEEPRSSQSKEAETTKEAADPHRKRPKDSDPNASFTERSLEFMAIMMDSMKEMQKRMHEPREDHGVVRGVETIRTGSPDLPPLAPWEAQQGPLILGDWPLLAEPIIADLSLTASEWWKKEVAASEDWYKVHMALSPLDRIKHPADPPAELQHEKWQRVERRVASMVLQAVPSQVRDELVASRRLTTFGVLTYLLVAYSPGGVSDKQNLLRNLEEPPEIPNVLDGPLALRRWLRWRTRTKEIGAIAPDPALQLKGLLKMTKKTLEQHRELQFRVSLVRSGLGVDTTPNDTNVEQLAYHLLAEYEQLALTEKRPGARSDPNKLKPAEAEKPKVAKLKKLEEEKGEGSPGRKEERGKCKFYLSDQGMQKRKGLPMVA